MRERVAQLFRLHDGRAELEDLDAGRDVRDLHRLVERHARPEHHPERRDDRVSGAAHVDHFVLRRPFVAPAAGLIQGHSLRAARDQKRAKPELLAQRLGLLRELVLVPPASHDLAQLGPVRSHHGRAGVSRIVVSLGIDEDALLALARDFDHLGDMREPALAVVGQDHDVAAGCVPRTARTPT